MRTHNASSRGTNTFKRTQTTTRHMQTKRERSAQIRRHSCITSCAAGVSPPATGPPRRFSNEQANAHAAAQDKIAPHLACQAHSTLRRRMGGSGFRCGQQAQEIGRFPDQRPPTSSASTTNRALASTHQLWISPFFQAPCTDQRHSVTLSSTRPRSAVRADGGDTRWCQGRAARPQREAVQCWMWDTKVQVTDQDIGRDPYTCFPAHFGRGHLHREATSRKQTRPWTRCAVVAKGVQRAATTIDGNTRRERQAETAKQQQAEQVRLDARVKARWRSGQSSTGHGTALRPEESLLSVVQPGHQAGVTAASSSQKYLDWLP